jgi:glutaredoxin-like YruB-family protein
MITIYSTPTCAFCHAAKEYLKSVDIPYEDVDVSQNYKAAEKMVSISGQLGVPVIDIDGDVLVGFHKPTFEAKLKAHNLLK